MAKRNTVIHINFVRKIFVKNSVAIFSFILNAHHIIFTVYNITSKQFSCKKFLSFCAKQKIFNNEKFVNNGMCLTKWLRHGRLGKHNERAQLILKDDGLKDRKHVS